jgi:MFS transporter, SP family, general alpha glucoside:H+ symporter
MCWGIGILISSAVADASVRLLPETSDIAWRLPFIIQWVWVSSGLFHLGCRLCLSRACRLYRYSSFSSSPQLGELGPYKKSSLTINGDFSCSPWWLVRQGRLEDAEKEVRRLTSKEYFSDEQVKHQVAMMVHTNALEIQASAGTTYFDCFKGKHQSLPSMSEQHYSALLIGIDRRRTEISMMVFASQLLSGQNLVGQSIQFLQRAGLPTRTAFSLNMVLNSMFCIGTIVSWGLVSAIGPLSCDAH